MRKIRIGGWLLVCLFVLSAGTASAQVSTGTISGTVKDSSGAVLPGTKVVVQNEGTSISRTVEADENGHYTVPSLNPGSYRVTGTRDGFQTEVRAGLVLSVAQEQVVDLSMTVGSVSQSVVVTGAAPLVESTTASVGSLVDDKTIRELPLNGRSWDQLALIQPGVIQTNPGTTGGSPYAFGTGKRFTVGGQRDVANSFLLDGTNVNDQANGTPGGAAGTNLGVDTILEFRIFTNSFKAELGHASGSVTTAVTRSGTNGFHGTAFEYIRNSVLDAKNFFDVGDSPPPFRRNQFGGVLGGPIKKDKTFFFVGYEGLRQALATTLTAIVPNDNARQGILPCTAVTPLPAGCGTTITTVTVPVNPIVVPYLNLYPIVNGKTFADGTGQFISFPIVPTNEDNVMARVDHQLNDKNSLFGRYELDTDSVNAQQNIPFVSLNERTRRQYTTAQWNSVLSPKAFNNVRFAFNRTHSDYDPEIASSVDPDLSFIPGQELGAINIGALNSSSLALTQLGSQAGNGPRFWIFNVFEGADDFSYTTGKHSLKFGTDIQRIQDNTASGQTVRGQYGFASLLGFLQGTPTALSATGPVGVLPEWGLRQSVVGVYAQDDYNLNSRITLNIGMRWETATDPHDEKGSNSILPTLSSTSMQVSDRFFSIGKENFEPRVGLAWKVDASGKTVVRSAVGIYHDQILPWAYQLNIINPPFFSKFTANNPPFPDGSSVLKPGTTVAVTVFPGIVKTPTDYQYNLTIEREIVKNTVFQIGYVGNQGRHQETEREADTRTPVFVDGNPAFPTYTTASPRLNPAFASIQQLQMNGNSSYNSLTTSVRWRAASGFEGQVSYTYAKAEDDSSGVSASDSVRSPQDIMNPFDLRQNWGLADFNVKHAAVGNFTYPFPFHASGRAMGEVVNGWVLNGIVTIQSGMPFTGLMVGGVSNDGALNLAERPDLVPGASDNPTHGVLGACEGALAGTPVRTAAHWYNPCAFQRPATGTYGDLGRNTIIGPGEQDIDLALAKTFELTESVRAIFRVEMFNVLNHANFGLPTIGAIQANGLPNGSAGSITTTLTPSRQMQFGLRIEF
jgi:hypothetical protein